MWGQVSTGMGVSIQLLVRKFYLGLKSNPGQLSLAIPAWTDAMSTSQRW